MMPCRCQVTQVVLGMPVLEVSNQAFLELELDVQNSAQVEGTIPYIQQLTFDYLCPVIYWRMLEGCIHH